MRSDRVASRLNIVPFSLVSAEEWQVEAWYCFQRDIRLEAIPDEPVLSKEELIQRTKAMEKLYNEENWALWNSQNNSLAALCNFRQSRHNQADVPASFDITVARSHRRKGIGSAMLGMVAECAKRYDRVILNCYTSNLFPAGEAFVQRTGAVEIDQYRFNKLRIRDVKKEILDKWLKLPEGKYPGIRTGIWTNEFPENRIDEICDFYQTVYDADNSKHNGTGFKYTRDTILEFEKASLSGSRKLTVYAVDSLSDKLLGFTEVYWNLLKPSVLSQKYTAVLPCARNRGIGRRLKAEMLTKIARELPEDVSIVTGNNSLNESILSINNELGFKLHSFQKTWQLETDFLVEFTRLHD